MLVDNEYVNAPTLNELKHFRLMIIYGNMMSMNRVPRTDDDQTDDDPDYAPTTSDLENDGTSSPTKFGTGKSGIDPEKKGQLLSAMEVSEASQVASSLTSEDQKHSEQKQAINVQEVVHLKMQLYDSAVENSRLTHNAEKTRASLETCREKVQTLVSAHTTMPRKRSKRRQ
jgi:hypothetical protein